MSRIVTIVALCLLTLISLGQANDGFYLGGIQVNEEDQAEWASNLKKAGMNTVEVTVYAKQGDWDSDNLWFDEKDTLIAVEIEAAKAQGLNVILILRVALDHAFSRNKFLWHGMIMPKDEALLSWFSKYRRFADYWATFAEKHHVDVVGISSEMNAMTSTLSIDSLRNLERFYLHRKHRKLYDARFLRFKNEIAAKNLWVRGEEKYEDIQDYINDRAQVQYNWAMQTTYGNDTSSVRRINNRSKLLDSLWRNTIKSVRSHYGGKLTYAANFDSYHFVSFWDALDYMGVNAYFKLRKLNDRLTEDVLQQYWTDVFDGMMSFQKKQSILLPVVFTELGYPFRKNCTVEPWNSHGFSVTGNRVKGYQLYVWPEQEINFEERALAVAALRQAVLAGKYPLRGILYWKLSSHTYHFKNEPFLLVLDGKDKLQKELSLFKKER